MPNRRTRYLLVLSLSLLLLVPPVLAASCEGLASLSIPDGKITSATMVAAGAFTQPGGSGPLAGGPGGNAAFKGAPAFCRVTATLTPSSDSDIKVEVWMPGNWNGKLVGIGNGVWAGNIAYSSMVEPISKGYAAVVTDTGHVGNGMDGKFAVGHKEKLVDFGYRAVHEMTVKAKLILAAYYGRKEQRSLWVSCSTGGRQGLMEAYRYPGDYNGISSMAPANPMVGLMIDTLWTGYAAIKDDAHKIGMPKWNAIHKAYVAQYDEKDGLKDGLVTDPEHCAFDPASLQCKAGQADADCLTAAQVETLRDIYGGVKNPRTKQLVFAGFQSGAEQQLAMLTGGNEPFPVATSYMRDLVFANPQWDFKSYDYDKDLAATYQYGSEILDVPSDGLSKFFAGGGKLLLSHGWADGLIPAPNTVSFYKTMTAKMDPKKATDSARLFMIPGMGHCGGGDGPTMLDMLSTIDNRVETGKAPESIVAKSMQKPISRPICPYPQVAKYKGTGSTDDAANFACAAK